MDNDHEIKARGYWLVIELADRARVSDARVRQLLLDGTIRGDKAGQVWTIPYFEGKRWLEERAGEEV